MVLILFDGGQFSLTYHIMPYLKRKAGKPADFSNFNPFGGYANLYF
jgi:hypothetical protein